MYKNFDLSLAKFYFINNIMKINRFNEIVIEYLY